MKNPNFKNFVTKHINSLVASACFVPDIQLLWLTEGTNIFGILNEHEKYLVEKTGPTYSSRNKD